VAIAEKRFVSPVEGLPPQDGLTPDTAMPYSDLTLASNPIGAGTLVCLLPGPYAQTDPLIFPIASLPAGNAELQTAKPVYIAATDSEGNVVHPARTNGGTGPIDLDDGNLRTIKLAADTPFMDPIPQHFAFHGLRIEGNHQGFLLRGWTLETVPKDLNKEGFAKPLGRFTVSSCSILNENSEDSLDAGCVNSQLESLNNRATNHAFHRIRRRA